MRKKNKVNCLNTAQRRPTADQLSAHEYDVLIVGGGITGAGIALDCASRGLKTALIEMQDFGAGTSSRSTKLIHGGLRYLKQFEFRLVAEVGRERAILHRNAPHLVIPEGMLLPIEKGGTFGKFGVWAGLMVYDLLAQVKKEERRTMLSRQATLDAEPMLAPDKLQGAGFYSEYRTDDARLTLSVIKTAVAHGATCLNYAKAKAFTYHPNGRVCGAKICDQLSGHEFEIRASEVVNATGPWGDQLRAKDGSLEGKRLHHTKGVHLVVNRERLPLQHSVYFDISDGRMMFAIPRGGATYFGTSDTNYDADPTAPWCSRADAEYLLKATNRMFPTAKLTQEDVRSSWAGIRPLIHEDGKSASELSRKDEIFHAPSNLITIAGGKLTGFRKMAQRVSDLVMERLIDRNIVTTRVDSFTDKIVLDGGDLQGFASVEDWKAGFLARYECSSTDLEYLFERWGTQAQVFMTEGKSFSLNESWSELLSYCQAEEACSNQADFFIRRTGLLYFERDAIPKLKQVLAGTFEFETVEFEREYNAVVAFKNQIGAERAMESVQLS